MRVHYDADKNFKLDDILSQTNLAKNFTLFFIASNLVLQCCLYSGLPNHLFRSEISVRIIHNLVLTIPMHIKINKKEDNLGYIKHDYARNLSVTR